MSPPAPQDHFYAMQPPPQSAVDENRLHPKAWVALLLNGFYSAAEALCSIFVAVYFWINSLDFNVVCIHYLALYATTPVFFLLAGWYAQVHDRLHVYRIGVVLHACYYALLLWLKETSVEYPVGLGILLGITWGFFWAGANTLNFDVTTRGRREQFFGLLASITGAFNLIAPMLGAVIIRWAPSDLAGYHRVFTAAIICYITIFVLSFFMPPDTERRPFRIKRALFPGPDQRDWRLIMLASASQAGAYTIFTFLLSLVMYMETSDEYSVGAFASFQALAGILTAYVLGRRLRPAGWRRAMWWGTALLLVAGAIMVLPITAASLVAFGFVRAIAGPFFSIPHFSMRMAIIAESVQAPHERIEYISAWEVPLALGRIVMMVSMMGLAEFLAGNSLGLRISIFLLCAIRVITYLILIRTTTLKNAEQSA